MVAIGCSTELQGSVQVRAGAARLLLLSSSAAIVNDSEGAPSARLVLGTATFSTGNAHAFTLFASTAAIRPQTDAPTIGQVTFLTDKELLVTARRGGLTVTVEDETQVVAEGEFVQRAAGSAMRKSRRAQVPEPRPFTGRRRRTTARRP